MAGAVGKFWFFRGHLNEGRATVREVLAQADGGAMSARPTAGYAKVLHAAALMDQGQGDYASSDEHLARALATAGSVRLPRLRRVATACPPRRSSQRQPAWLCG